MQIDNDQLALSTLTVQSIKKIGMFSDIHFGAHHNSNQHNQDCIEFIDWFIEQCKVQSVDAIGFLGDWFETRNAINILTLKHSNTALRKLNALGLPIFFIIGNHDLYHRHNREVHSADLFREFENVHIIEEPVKVNDSLLFLPFLFNHEYSQVVNLVNASEYVFGHFEFRNFYLTGSTHVAEHGYHHKLFDGPKHIFSGHYHKRQASDNVIYIGNPFATSYADAGDYQRGCCFLETTTGEVDFVDYDGPTYVKTRLSSLLADEVDLRQRARVKCVLDVEVTYSEAQTLKAEFLEAYQLREFSLEENSREQQAALEETAMAELDELDLSSLDETVKKLIEAGVQATTTIDPKKLIVEYEAL